MPSSRWFKERAGAVRNKFRNNERKFKNLYQLQFFFFLAPFPWPKCSEVCPSAAAGMEIDTEAPTTGSGSGAPVAGNGLSTLPLDVLFAVVNSSSFVAAELFRLCPTCKGWRDIILENQDLWCHVTFRPCERKVTGEVLQRILSEPRTRNLITLDVSHCSLLQTSDLHVVIRRCGSRLETLELTNCQAVDDSVLRTISETCRKLTFLGINNLQRISDKGVQLVVQKISTLKMLEVTAYYVTHMNACV